MTPRSEKLVVFAAATAIAAATSGDGTAFSSRGLQSRTVRQSPSSFSPLPDVNTAFILNNNNNDARRGRRLLRRSFSSLAASPRFENLNDENSSTLLNPDPLSSSDNFDADAGRPVLVDACAPFCGPCKLLDKVLRKSHSKYESNIDFVRWNMNDKEGTKKFRKFLLDEGYAFTKLPTLVLFRNGMPMAMRMGFANENQLDKFLEDSLPDVLEKTFDENGLKMTEPFMEYFEDSATDDNATNEEKEKKAPVTATAPGHEAVVNIDDLQMDEVVTVIEERLLDESVDGVETACVTEETCMDMVEQSWEERTVTPAMDGIANR